MCTSAELFAAGSPCSLAGISGESSCRLSFLYCHRERCRTKLVIGLLLVAAGNIEVSLQRARMQLGRREVRQMCKNYKLDILSSAAVAINLFFLSSKYSSYFLSEDLILEG